MSTHKNNVSRMNVYHQLVVLIPFFLIHPVYLNYAIIETYVASQIGMETAEWPGLPHTLHNKKTGFVISILF